MLRPMADHALLEVEGLGDCRVISLRGREAINEVPRFEIVAIAAPGADLAAVVGSPVGLVLVDGFGGTRALTLTVVSACDQGASRDGQAYELVVSHALAALGHRAQHRIFQEKTAQEIVSALLDEAGLASDLALRLAGQYQKRTYCVQYGETELDFAARLLADDGINFWVQSDDKETKLVLGDGSSAHDGLEGGPDLAFMETTGLTPKGDAFFELSRTASIVHDKVHVRDYDVRAPDVPIEGIAGDGALEWYEHPANVMSEAASARAKVRLEQLQREAIRLDGKSRCARLAAGRVVRIAGAADAFFEGEMLVVSVEHEVRESVPGRAAAHPYENRATLVPLDRPFRPALPEHAPRSGALESAEVTGPGGEEIHVDDLGRIKARFRWDRSAVADDKSSLWIRHAQMNMAGSMMLPRVGWEVPIAYEDGDPDRPMALGRMYNGGAPPPYGMPGKKATTTFQSATSPSDGTTQEVRLGDDAGAQEVFVHATKDQTVTVGGSQTTTVGGKRTDDVTKSSELYVGGSQSTSVGGSQTVTAGADFVVGVKGARSVSVGGSENYGVTGTATWTVGGAFTETVGGVHTLRCNQSNTTVQGAYTNVVGGALLTTSGLGMSQSVAAARTETLGGARLITAASGYGDKVTGAKSIKAGAATEKAALITTDAATISMKAGGSATFTAGAALVVEAATIDLTAASITAKGGTTLKIGGSIKASGKVKFKASTTKKTSTAKTG